MDQMANEAFNKAVLAVAICPADSFYSPVVCLSCFFFHTIHTIRNCLSPCCSIYILTALTAQDVGALTGSGCTCLTDSHCCNEVRGKGVYET